MSSIKVNPWISERLIYRAVETPDDDELFQKLSQDPLGFGQSDPALQKPQSRADAMRHQKAMMEKCLIGVVICLPASTPSAKPTAIGQIHIDLFIPHHHHRTGRIGLSILPEYQGKGYGTEAIRWITDWAFKAGNLHRVMIHAFEWNEGARRLYERLGFRLEGTWREHWWFDGRYWDDYTFAVLEREWRELRAKEREADQ